MKKITFLCSIILTTLVLGACSTKDTLDAPLSKDAQIIKTLEEKGHNLSQARNIDFFLYFPDEANARNAAKTLKAEAYQIQVSKDDFKKMWLVLATKKILPNEALLNQLRQQFEAMTSQAQGKYLDWGIPLSE